VNSKHKSFFARLAAPQRTMMSPFKGYSKRRSEVDKNESFKLIEIPFSPLRKNEEDWVEEHDYVHGFQFANCARDYGSRQAYLRSYTFSRESNQAPEGMKKSLLRLKAAAWAVVACNYKLPLRARLLKEKIAIRTSQYLNNGMQFLRPSCMQMPKCLMATT
jgi:hypothetical protein